MLSTFPANAVCFVFWFSLEPLVYSMIKRKRKKKFIKFLFEDSKKKSFGSGESLPFIDEYNIASRSTVNID